MNKVAVFIDGNDFYNSIIDNNLNPSINYLTFGRKLCNDHRELIRVYYYNVLYKQQDDKDKYKKQQKFISALEQTDYVQPDFLRSIFDAKVKLVVNMLEFAHRNVYDTAIIVSKSGSYAPAIKSVKSLGKHTELVFFNDGIDALRNVTDKYTELDEDFLNACLFKK